MNKRILIINVLIGIILIAFPIISSPDFNEGWMVFKVQPFQRSLLRYLFILGFYFLNYYVLVPQFYFKKKHLLYTLFCLAAFEIISLIPGILFPHNALAPGHILTSAPPMMGAQPGRLERGFNFRRWLLGMDNYVFEFAMVLTLSLLMRISQKLESTKNEKLRAELSYLKAQVNPHFFFNTLNSIYSLALKKSEEAPAAVLKISNIMRYAVSEGTRDFVPLERELAYIKDYIDLQSLRLSDTVDLNVTISDNAKGGQIVPMLLFPYIENAFKYGIDPDRDCLIQIDIRIQDLQLHLHTYNSCIVENSLLIQRSAKFGTHSTKQFLERLYPGKFELKVANDKKTYTLDLKIDLS